MPRRLAASTDSLNALGRDDHDDGALGDCVERLVRPRGRRCRAPQRLDCGR
jgi:hypothetical protein